MKNTPKDNDEVRLEKLGKSLLAMPQKMREDSKFGKPHAVKKKPSKKAAQKLK